MPDRIVSVSANGTLFERVDGTRYFSAPFGIASYECETTGNPSAGTAPNGLYYADCAKLLGTPLPTLNPDVPGALVTDLERRLGDQLSNEALSILSFLPVPPSSAIGQVVEIANQSGLGLVPLLELVPPLASIVNAEAAQVDAAIAANTIRDPRDGKSSLELYLDGRDRTASYAPLVAAEQEKAMGLLDDLLGGFSTTPIGINPNAGLGAFFPTFNPTLDAGSPPIGTTSGGVLSGLGTVGQVLDAVAPSLIGILGALAQRGVIRGTVGELLAPSQQSPSAGVSAGNVAAMNLAAGGQMPGLLESLLLALGPSGNSVGDGTMTGSALSMLENALGVNQGGSCGNRSVRLNAMQAMPLFKQGCARAFIPRRIFVDGPDGTPYVLYNAGQASIGSREQSVARSIARRSGFKLVRRGGGGGGRRRRSPR